MGLSTLRLNSYSAATAPEEGTGNHTVNQCRTICFRAGNLLLSLLLNTKLILSRLAKCPVLELTDQLQIVHAAQRWLLPRTAPLQALALQQPSRVALHFNLAHFPSPFQHPAAQVPMRCSQVPTSHYRTPAHIPGAAGREECREHTHGARTDFHLLVWSPASVQLQHGEKQWLERRKKMGRSTGFRATPQPQGNCCCCVEWKTRSGGGERRARFPGLYTSN